MRERARQSTSRTGEHNKHEAIQHNLHVGKQFFKPLLDLASRLRLDVAKGTITQLIMALSATVDRQHHAVAALI